MQNPRYIPWTEILIAILGFVGLLFFGGFIALFLLVGLLQTNQATHTETVQILGMAVMFGIECLLLLPGLWFLYRKVTDHPEPDREVRLPFSLWQIPVALTVWAGALWAGQWASGAPDPAWLLLPFLMPFAILPPIWLALNLAARGYDFRPRWRGWSVVTVGSTLGPFLLMVLEIAAIIAVILVVVVFVVLQPELNTQLQRLSSEMGRASAPEEILSLLAPLLMHPAFVGGLLFVVSILIPMIEEMVKPLAVWLFAKQLDTVRDGFVLGAVSGTAYALFETIGLGSGAGSNWLVVLGARGGTSLLHIVTSAMMGAAIVGAARERKYLRLAGIYFASILLHGLWNAFAILNSLGEAAKIVSPNSLLATLGKLSPYGLGAVVAMLLAIVILTQRGLQAAVAVPAPVEVPPEDAALVS